jgi:hypothetical protein
MSKAGDYVTIAGKSVKLQECNTCKALFYFDANPNKDKPGEKSYVRKNLDGSLHVDKKADFRKPQPYKRTIAIGKLFSQNYQSIRIEISQEFSADEPDWRKQYKNVNDMVDEKIAEEKAKIVK